MKPNNLTLKDLDPLVAKIIRTKKYEAQKQIDGVKFINLNYLPSEGGGFTEIFRPKTKNLDLPNFDLQQISYSQIDPGTINAWHLHLKQDDLWFVPPSSKLFVGLHDLRKDSSTFKKTMRVVLGNHSARLLFIPRGVAHGYANLSPNQASLTYLMSNTFDIKNPDELRFSRDYLGKNFWEKEIM